MICFCKSHSIIIETKEKIYWKTGIVLWGCVLFSVPCFSFFLLPNIVQLFVRSTRCFNKRLAECYVECCAMVQVERVDSKVCKDFFSTSKWLEWIEESYEWNEKNLTACCIQMKNEKSV